MTFKPGAIISDTYSSLQGSASAQPIPNGGIRATPSYQPLFVQQQDSTYLEFANPVIPASTTSASGAWTLTLPAQSDCDPNTVTWTITLPDGYAWSGAVTSAMVTASLITPLSLHVLKNSYGWGIVQSGGTTVVAITGPAGASGASSSSGTQRTVSANTTALITDGTIFVNSSNKTITLPDATTVTAGTTITLNIVNLAGITNTTIAAFGAQTVQGAASTILSPALACMSLQTNGANWFIV